MTTARDESIYVSRHQMKIFRGQPDHDHSGRPFTPTEKANAWAGLGIGLLVLGAMKWLSPDVPPFSGEWSWAHSALYHVFGPRGKAIAMFVLGSLLLIAAVLTWLTEKRK